MDGMKVKLAAAGTAAITIVTSWSWASDVAQRDVRPSQDPYPAGLNYGVGSSSGSTAAQDANTGEERKIPRLERVNIQLPFEKR